MILLERTEVCVCARSQRHAMYAVCVYNSVDVICTSARFQTMLFYLQMQLFIEYTWFSLSLVCELCPIYLCIVRACALCSQFLLRVV